MVIAPQAPRRGPLGRRAERVAAWRIAERIRNAASSRIAIAGTTHRLDCPGGCAPLPAARCIQVIRQAISEAVNMAVGGHQARRLAEAWSPHAGCERHRAPLSVLLRSRPDPAGCLGGRHTLRRQHRRPVPTSDRISLRGCRVVRGRCRCHPPRRWAIVEPNVINLCGPFWAPPVYRGFRPRTSGGRRFFTKCFTCSSAKVFTMRAAA